MSKQVCDHWWVSSLTGICSGCGKKFENAEEYIREMGSEKMKELQRRINRAIINIAKRYQ